MDLSSCCGAPVVVEFVSDSPNFTDDNYDLKIPIRVCSLCGKVLSRYPTDEGGGDK